MLWNKKPGRKPSDADKPNDLRMASTTLALWTRMGRPTGPISGGRFLALRVRPELASL